MKRWILVSRCGECKELIPFDPCSFLGYNPGVNGHLFKNKEEAEDALEATRRAIIEHHYEMIAETSQTHYLLEGPFMKDGSFWTDSNELIHLTHERPCFIPNKHGFMIHDLIAVADVRAVEIQFL